MSQEFDCHYGEEEFDTIKAGIDAIEAVLTGSDIHAKENAHDKFGMEHEQSSQNNSNGI